MIRSDQTKQGKTRQGYKTRQNNTTQHKRRKNRMRKHKTTHNNNARQRNQLRTTDFVFSFSFLNYSQVIKLCRFLDFTLEDK